jgi:hypothetical protein
MDSDRKYRQHGYQDNVRDDSTDGRRPEERPRQPGPRLPLDVTGPRLPRLVQSVTAARCYNCATTLQPDTDFRGNCPKCGAALHCCKQCAHFEPSKLFQCLKPIPARIALKDQANECSWFSPSVTVARDATHGSSAGTSGPTQSPRGPSEARAAFDSLFKK